MLCKNDGMYVIAAIGDLFSLIPFVNIVSSPVTAFALYVAGAGTGANIFSTNRIGATLVVLLIELIPGVSIVPTWTIRVYFAKKHARESEG